MYFPALSGQCRTSDFDGTGTSVCSENQVRRLIPQRQFQIRRARHSIDVLIRPKQALNAGCPSCLVSRIRDKVLSPWTLGLMLRWSGAGGHVHFSERNIYGCLAYTGIHPPKARPKQASDSPLLSFSWSLLGKSGLLLGSPCSSGHRHRPHPDDRRQPGLISRPAPSLRALSESFEASGWLIARHCSQDSALSRL